MRRVLWIGLLAMVSMTIGISAAHAWVIHGRVICGESGEGVPGVQVDVVSTDGAGFAGSNETNGDGWYVVYLPDGAGCYRASLVLGPGQSAVDPASGQFEFCTSLGNEEFLQHFSILTPDCAEREEGACWLTAGGAKFNPLTGTNLGEHGPQHSWGGNVYPGCSSTAGDGGNWNHIAHALKLHFQGREITVERCGNIAGIEPGSESPVTPFNYIEFNGIGTLKGIKGNKVDHGTVYFWAHCEDRNEPGSSGQRDGAEKDRYFLHVFSDPGNRHGSTLLLIDVDGNSTTVDPVTITDGNMQIHISSCDDAAIGITRALDAGARSIAAPPEGTTWGKLKITYRK